MVQTLHMTKEEPSTASEVAVESGFGAVLEGWWLMTGLLPLLLPPTPFLLFGKKTNKNKGYRKKQTNYHKMRVWGS